MNIFWVIALQVKICQLIYYLDDVTRVNLYGVDDEDSTHDPLIHYDRTGQDGSRDHHSKTTSRGNELH